MPDSFNAAGNANPAAGTLLKDKLAMPETAGELRKDRDALLSS